VFIELIDILRCINAHEDTWLVASFKTVTNRFVLEASLGCPSCSAQYTIYEGVADFTAGVWAYAAQELSEMADVRVLALNASDEVKESHTVALLRVGSSIPVAPGSVLGVALDAWFPAAIVDSAVRAVRPGGRIVGPAAIPTPAELTVLAHDDNYWVAQKAPEVVTISRASR